MVKKLIFIIIYLSSMISCAKTSETLISEVYYCLKDDTSKIEIAFDRYNSRIIHRPFTSFHKLKEVKTVIYDDESKALETTYKELEDNREVASFTFISKGNEFWGATYTPINKEVKDLDETRFNLNKINATCF